MRQPTPYLNGAYPVIFFGSFGWGYSPILFLFNYFGRVQQGVVVLSFLFNKVFCSSQKKKKKSVFLNGIFYSLVFSNSKKVM